MENGRKYLIKHLKAKSFTYILSSNSHNTPVVLIIFVYFKEEETDIQHT